jgi:hypothetical protein
VDIACSRSAAHIVPIDIWPNMHWVNNYNDLETNNDVLEDKDWK